VLAKSALEVFSSGQRAGQLDRSDLDADTFLFNYAADCNAEHAVSLTMPVVRDAYDAMGTVHPVFEMNLPEGALLEKLTALFAKTVANFDALALLAIVGRSQIGRLRFALAVQMPDEVPAQSLGEILSFRGAGDLFLDLLDRYASYSGVSGMQPKVLVRAADADLPRATHRGATHIVKAFDPREYPELAANEHFCLCAARHAGIPVAEAQLSLNRRVLLVSRFDLKTDGSYLGCEDFCVLSGLRAHGRYNGAYETVATRIVQFVSPRLRRAALEQFFLTVALSCAVENGDAHLKNFAVLYEHAESEVHLAPAFDIVSTTLYQRRDVLALSLGGSKAFPDRARLVTFGRTACGLGKERVEALLTRVGAGVRKAMREIARYQSAYPDFAKAGTLLSATFERGRRRSIDIV
jgi:serine/threonine-protein kinase HipA